MAVGEWPVAMAAMANGVPYIDLLRENEVVKANLSDEELDGCFTLDYYMKNVDYIFEKVFGQIKD